MKPVMMYAVLKDKVRTTHNILRTPEGEFIVAVTLFVKRFGERGLERISSTEKVTTIRAGDFPNEAELIWALVKPLRDKLLADFYTRQHKSTWGD